MKLKSLILGSIAAAGLTTGAQAADLSVLTSLDVCDLLGMSGLTISSDTNCLAITGEVKYEFVWGDYEAVALTVNGGHDTIEYMDNDFGVVVADNQDWTSKVDAYLQFVGAAESDFGTAKAVIKFDYDNDTTVINELVTAGPTNVLRIQDAYVSVGDTTILMAGQKSSIFKNGDDAPLNWMGLYNANGIAQSSSEGYDSTGVSKGVDTPVTDYLDGGPSHVIQVVYGLDNGVSFGAGLENLNSAKTASAALGYANAANVAGVFAGYVAYSGDGISAHASVIGGGILDGVIENWGFHAGFTGTFDQFKVVGAFAADSNNYWNGLISASGTFDMFTLAASAEFVDRSSAAGDEGFGFGASASAAVTDDVTINVGFRYFDETTAANDETWNVAAQIVAALTETVKVTGEVGLVSNNRLPATADLTYGSVELAWAPGGGFTSSIKGEVNSYGGYKIITKAAKSFK